MKSKKIICSLLAITMSSLIIFSGCSSNKTQSSSQPSSSSKVQTSISSSSASSSSNSSSEASSSSQITPTVWKVTSKDGNYMYMMGSVHAADSSIQNMPDYFESAYAQCDSLAFEADTTTMTTDVSMLKKFTYSDGTKISSHISKDTYNKAVNVLKGFNSYTALLDNYKPFMWTSLMDYFIIQQAGLNINNGVDTTLIKRAKNDKKEVLEVESVDYQLNLIAGLSDEIQETLLKSYVEDGAIDKQTKELKELYSKWKSGTITDADVSDSSQEESMTTQEKKLLEEYNQKLLYTRNKNMAAKAEKYMSSGKTVMLVVGAAHFYGENGILQLMKNDGCTVTALSSKDVVSKPAAQSSVAASSAAESSKKVIQQSSEVESGFVSETEDGTKIYSA